MRVVIKKDNEAMSRYAAAKWIGAMMQPGRVNLAPTAGSTPKRMYELVTEFLQDGEAMVENNEIYYYQQDNLVSTLKPDVPSFFPEIDEMFWGPNNVPEERIKRLTLDAYKTAHEDIEADGGLDLVLMGLGADGHFAANMPGTPFNNRGFMENDFPEEMLQQMRDAFNAPDADAWTVLGPETLMQAKEILMIVSGKGKAEIVKQVLEGPVTEDVPASILRFHPNMTLVLDEDAASLLSK